MEGRIGYDPARKQYTFYVGGGGAALYREVGETRIVNVERPGDEWPPFLKMSEEEYRALRDAIVAYEHPQIADRALLREAWDDARETRDRLLTMLEES
jgi:hypothetical protein